MYNKIDNYIRHNGGAAQELKGQSLINPTNRYEYEYHDDGNCNDFNKINVENKLRGNARKTDNIHIVFRTSMFLFFFSTWIRAIIITYYNLQCTAYLYNVSHVGTS